MKISKQFMQDIINSKVLAEQTLSYKLALAGIRQGVSFNLDKCLKIGVFGFTKANKIKRIQCSIGVLKAFQSKLEVVKVECSGEITCEETINNEIKRVKKKLINLNKELEKLKND